MRRTSSIAVVVALGMLLAACTTAEPDLSTTSSLVGGATTTALPSSTTTTEASITSTTLVGETIVEFDVVVRVPDDNGDVLYILIPPGAYTDIDLENFIGDLRDGNPSLWGVEVFDNADALAAFQVPEDQRSEDQQKLLDEHHFVSLVEGDLLRFQGPFSEFGEFVLSS